ncbi:hypothetical protein [Burkholderia territorii]|uniref:hypothetical protein n=1 Tax=Burkholderia territorii TaxID=1503055 RepID=UPI00075961DA|nr:hypothetical protein [Burkholderia territorii]KWE27762.1 hypothetical protein WT49_28325 [Burkholderia territorii]KWE35828.1 hypothetical protein WT50_24000 [Burkholderia territorii]KWE38256.1 hypothetical protein WT51_30800 [Burkholderia territorii]
MERISAGLTTLANTEIIIEYLTEHERASFRDMVRSAPLEACAIREALQYGIRHGVIVSEKQTGAAPGEPAHYRLTGRSLPELLSSLEYAG